MRKTLQIFALSFLTTTYSINAQVSDVKEKVDIQKYMDQKNENNKSNSSSSNNSNDSDDTDNIGNSIFSEVFKAIFYAVGYVSFLAIKAGQEEVLEHVEEHPEYISLEINTPLAYGLPKDYFLAQPKVQGNWGIFATEFRYSYLKDETGDLSSIDWQILKTKIPISGFQPFCGLGFTHLFNQKKTYFEYSTGFDWRMFKNNVNWNFTYRRATDEGDNFRSELETKIDYLVYKKNTFHVYPQIGVNYQNYFDSIDVTAFNLGVTFRFQ